MSNNQPKTGAKDFFVNLGAIVALGVIVFNVIDLLFTIIDKAYPLIQSYSYYSSYSISWPVSSLIIFFPIYISLMWLLEKDYAKEPERRNLGIRKWLTYITLFLSGLTIAGDLVTVIYYFVNGEEITKGFIMKVLSVLVVALAIFFYYISDVMGKINRISRRVWVGVSLVVVLGVIIWGFSVLGSPRTQRLMRYDEQTVNEVQSINNSINYYWELNKKLPGALTDIDNCSLVSNIAYYPGMHTPCSSYPDNKPFEYKKTGDKTYNLCADFNKEITTAKAFNYMNSVSKVWDHPAGHYCYSLVVPESENAKIVPASNY